MYRFKWRNVNNASGYTLLEAILHLMLFIVFSHLVFVLTLAYMRLTDMKDARVELDWEVVVYDINTYLSIEGEVSVTNDGNQVEIVNEDKLVILRFYNNILWRNEKGGNETILTGVKHASFSLHQHELTLIATLENDLTKERTFIVKEAVE